MELYTIEALELELKQLYAVLEVSSDTEEKECIQQAIQQRNLQLVRLCPNE